MACLVLGAVAAGITGWVLWRRAPTSKPVARFTISLPPNEIVSSFGNSVAISSDGTRVAFAGGSGGRAQVYLREIAGLDVKPIAPFSLPMANGWHSGTWAVLLG